MRVVAADVTAVSLLAALSVVTELRDAEMSTMFFGNEFTPSFESIWHGMPHSKHSNTSYWGMAAPKIAPASFFYCTIVPLREKPGTDLPVFDG